jgi:hypothetical protein
LRYVPGYHLRRGWYEKRVWHGEHLEPLRHGHHTALCLNDRSGWQQHHGGAHQHHGQGEENHHHYD